MQPDILLMDEPTSALDPVSALVVEQLACELKRDLYARGRYAQYAAGGAYLRLGRRFFAG